MGILIFVIALLTLVVIHELGHFLVAKKFGIKVLEFGFGIPPMIWGKKIGETLVSINWLPIGGFVRLMGEDENPKIVPKENEKGRDYRFKPVGQRIAVVVAGVVMNMVLAWVLFYGVLALQNWRIIYPVSEPVVAVSFVEEHFPAQKAGLQAGDVIKKVDGIEVVSAKELTDIIKSKPDTPIILEIADLDGNQAHIINVTPVKNVDGEGKIGVALSPIPFKEYKTTQERLFSGMTYSWDITKLTFGGLGKLFSDIGNRNFDKASDSVAGPVGLAVQSEGILRLGITTYLWFMGILSLSLAIFNFLPLPALDGGRLFFLYIEAIFGKKVSAEMENKVHSVGMVVLLALAAIIAFSDIQKYIL